MLTTLSKIIYTFLYPIHFNTSPEQNVDPENVVNSRYFLPYKCVLIEQKP